MIETAECQVRGLSLNLPRNMPQLRNYNSEIRLIKFEAYGQMQSGEPSNVVSGLLFWSG